MGEMSEAVIVTGSRSDDALVAVAMGMEVCQHGDGTWWERRAGLRRGADAYSTWSRLRGYTTRRALVVPMMERMGEWGQAVELVLRPDDGRWMCHAWDGTPGIVYPGPTAVAESASANIAVAAALLEVNMAALEKGVEGR